MKLFLLLFYLFNVLTFKVPFEQNRVVLHLEKFNEQYNLLHIGISFQNDIDTIRFDYRPFNYRKSYITKDKERLDAAIMFPDAIVNNYEINFFNDYRNMLIFDTDNTNKKNIFWGITNKTQEEILNFEKENLINKKYRAGIYDCRHYVNEFSTWCLNKPTPVWRLNKLWNDYNLLNEF